MLKSGQIYGKDMTFPPRVGADGRVSWSEGEENVRESIRVILLTEQRERLRLPTFGGSLARYLFEPNTVTTRQLIKDRITKELAQWEPRVAVENVSVEADADDPQAAVATINYRLVATNKKEAVSLTVSLTG
ncbi:MAG: GPW/gp25 family protein [Acidobacteria bacterium]|nr:GPW/gp25 family protein [Acidobacteriota bacterium]